MNLSLPTSCTLHDDRILYDIRISFLGDREREREIEGEKDREAAHRLRRGQILLEAERFVAGAAPIMTGEATNSVPQRVGADAGGALMS